MIYLDVTTLLHWSRPPVGIVKTLLEYAKYGLSQDEVVYVLFARNSIIPLSKSEIADHIAAIESGGKESFQKPEPFRADIATVTHPFSQGDTLVSIGLDWDYSDYDLLYRLKKRVGFRFVGAFYDLIPLSHPHLVPSFYNAQRFALYLYRLLHLSDKLFAISHYSARTLRDFMRSHSISHRPKIEVIYLGDSLHGPTASPPPRPHDSMNYTLYVSTVEARKNHIILLQAYQKLFDEGFTPPHLLFVGMRGWGVEELYALYEADKRLHDHIYFYEDVDDAELAYLYANARYTFFPSFVEGWGLASRESLLSGTPVLVSNTPALVEATQNLMPALPPHDPDYWSEAIRLMEEGYEEELRKEITYHFRSRSWGDFSRDFHIFVKETE